MTGQLPPQIMTAPARGNNLRKVLSWLTATSTA